MPRCRNSGATSQTAGPRAPTKPDQGETAGGAADTSMAGRNKARLHFVRETADLWFHSLILLSQFGLGPDDVLAELHRREGISGIDEKKSRGNA